MYSKTALPAALALACTFYGGAFLVLAAGSAVLLYISYVMPTAAALFKSRKRFRERKYNLGPLSKPSAVIAILGGLVLTSVGFQPPNQAVIKLIAGMLVVMGLVWFAFERRRFK